MKKTQYIWHNGEYKNWDDATTHVLTHTLHYGGGAFEGIRVYDTAIGTGIFRLKEHVKRLYYSAKILGIEIPYPQTDLINTIIELVKINKLKFGYVRPIVYYGYGSMGVNPNNNPIEIAIACWPWGAYLSHDKIDVKTSKYIRIHPESTVVDAKLCGHYLNSILASLELRNTHYHEVLFLDTNGYISEGAGENFFIVKDNCIFTPQLGSILPGITRDTIIEIASSLHYPIIEKALSLNDAYAADEAFFTGTAAEVTPIHSIDDKKIGEAERGPVTELIKKAYHDIVTGKNKDYINYLTISD